MRVVKRGPYLASVALEVKVLLQSHHPHRLLTARGRDDGLIAAHADRREAPEREREREREKPRGSYSSCNG